MRDVTTVDGRQSQVILSELGERREALVEAMQTELPKVGREGGKEGRRKGGREQCAIVDWLVVVFIGRSRKKATV